MCKMNAKKWKWILNECKVERPKWSYEGRNIMKQEIIVMLPVFTQTVSRCWERDKAFKRNIYRMTKSFCLKT